MPAITVVINNRNLLTWPRAMVERIEQFSSLGDILIIDNGSTYVPLLDWYATIPHRVIRTSNLGHTAPWTPEINAQITTDLYVVTDADLDLSRTPVDCLDHLAKCLSMFPSARKIGLALDFSDVPRAFPYYDHVHSWEQRFWDLPLIWGLVRQAPVDTTFALYSKRLMNEYRVIGGRTDAPYVAGHIPWTVVEPDAEFAQYLATTNGSSSYRHFIGKPRR